MKTDTAPPYSPLRSLRDNEVPTPAEDRARLDALRPEIDRALAQGYSPHQVWQTMRQDRRTALPYEQFRRHLARPDRRCLGVLVQRTGLAFSVLGLIGLGFFEPATGPHTCLSYGLVGGLPLVAAGTLLRL